MANTNNVEDVAINAVPIRYVRIVALVGATHCSIGTLPV